MNYTALSHAALYNQFYSENQAAERSVVGREILRRIGNFRQTAGIYTAAVEQQLRADIAVMKVRQRL